MRENNSSLHNTAKKLSFSTFLASLLIAVLPLILIRFSAAAYKILQNSYTLWIILVLSLILISLVSGSIAIRRTKSVLLWLIPILIVFVYIGWDIYQITQPSKIPIGWIPEGIYANENNHENNEKTKWPKTVEDAVEIIIKHLSEKDKEMIKSASKYDLIAFHHGWVLK